MTQKTYRPDQPDPLAQSANRLIRWVARHWLFLFNLAWAVYVFTPFLAPIFMRLGWQLPAHAIYTIYSSLCHQLPDHSYFLFGPTYAPSTEAIAAAGFPTDVGLFLFRRMIGSSEFGYKVALCQRDVAIYGAVLLAGLLYGLLRTHMQIRSLRLWVYGLLVMPMAVDGVTQLLGWHDSNWWLRTITGMLFGLASVWLAYPYVEQAMGEVITAEA